MLPQRNKGKHNSVMEKVISKFSTACLPAYAGTVRATLKRRTYSIMTIEPIFEIALGHASSDPIPERGAQLAQSRSRH